MQRIVSASKSFTWHTMTRSTSTKHLAVVLTIRPYQLDARRMQAWSYRIAKIFATVTIVVLVRRGLGPVRVIETVAVPSRLLLSSAFPVWSRVKSIWSWPTYRSPKLPQTYMYICTCTLYMYIYATTELKPFAWWTANYFCFNAYATSSFLA